jgi:hypothetical protein
LGAVNKPVSKTRDVVEWLIIAGVVFMVAHLFLANNGFVGHSDIQPYPY